jgi:glycosyltransferase involved in cell wall biosynthesis
MYKKKILFSIITVVLNNRKKLKKCIKSVLTQNYRNFEHIIIDGGSTDGTHNILKEYNKDVKKIIIKKDNNMWEAMNTGIKNANGEIICILNSDDYFTKNALKIVNNYFLKNDIDYFFGAVKKRKIFYHFNPEYVDYKFNCYPSHSVSFFIKKKIHNKIGLYDEKLKYCSDFDLFYKLFKNKKFKYMNGKRNELIGYFDSSGVSSRIGFFKTLYYESKVRIKNKQNILIVISLFVLRVINKFRNYFR